LARAGVTGQWYELLDRIPNLIGGLEVLDEATNLCGRLAEGSRAVTALERLARVFRLLQAYKVADRVILDLSEVRGMDYYTGITFRGVAPGLGWPIVSGGRYDELIAHFGRPLAAVGFGLGIERVLLVQSRQGRAVPYPAPALLMHCCDHESCLTLLRNLRQRGYNVEMDVLGLARTDLIDQARLRGIQRVLYCGDGQWSLWDADGERVVTPESLLQEAERW
jgi:ATP phosphoribosyltransferase regulatory subunit